MGGERLAAQGDRRRRRGRRIRERPAEARLRLDAARRLTRCGQQIRIERRESLDALGRVLESVSYRKVLERGYAVVRGPEGLVAGAAAVTPGLALDIEFADGHVAAQATGATKPSPKQKVAKKAARDDPQGSLL